ncbi:MAG: hypothetical protein ACE1Y9_01640, partial [Acidimicrobiia bacterium]
MSKVISGPNRAARLFPGVPGDDSGLEGASSFAHGDQVDSLGDDVSVPDRVVDAVEKWSKQLPHVDGVVEDHLAEIRLQQVVSVPGDLVGESLRVDLVLHPEGFQDPPAVLEL